MTDSVDANPDEVRKLATALQKYQREVQEAGKAVQGAINRANWHDRKKDQFVAHHRDFQRQVDRFVGNETPAMVKSLNELARRLDDVIRTKM